MERNERVAPISIAMPASMAHRIRVLAAQEDKSRSQFVRELLERFLAGDDVTQEQSLLETESD
jgi:predicted DNA-binding protein